MVITMAKKSARAVALDALVKYEQSRVWSQNRLSRAISDAELGGRDAAFATYLCGGVLQNTALLDHNLSKFSKIPLKKLETRVLCILRLGTFQLMFASSVPASAAVNESNILCGKDKRKAGFVNAVLRAFSRAENPFEVDTGDEVCNLSVRFSHPEWIVRELVSHYGVDFAREALEKNNEAAPVTIQINTLRATAAEVIASFAAEGAGVTTHEWLLDCATLSSAADIENHAAFMQGHFWVQDAASNLAVRALNPEREMKILDLCAAPGGKSFAAAVLSGAAEITSCDISARKLELVRESAERLGISVDAQINDAGVFCEEWVDKFDAIICDLPCSGLGIIRKKPDIRYKDEKSVSELPVLQSKILDVAAKYLKSGGRLLYSTCTWREAEDGAVFRGFLERNSGFKAVDFELPHPVGAKLRSENGMLTLWPHIHGTDGFFISLAQKK